MLLLLLLLLIKTSRLQDIACDLGGMNLDSSGEGTKTHSCSPMVCGSTDGSPVPPPPPTAQHAGHQQQRRQQQQQQQNTPRGDSDCRTPSLKTARGGGGGGGGAGGSHPQQQQQQQRPSPMCLADALSLHPTSPSDPGLESNLDLRRVSGAERSPRWSSD